MLKLLNQLKTHMAQSLCILLLFMNGSAAEQTVASPIKAVIHYPEEVYDGYLFWHQADELREDVDNISILTDASGNLVHIWQTNLTGGGTPAYLLEQGGVLRTGITNRENTKRGPVASSDTVQITDTHGDVVWEINAKDLGDLLFHHDVELMPNGNILISTYEPMTADEALAIGWNPGNQKIVWADGVIEVMPDLQSGSSEIVWRWSVADHLIQDQLPDAPNFGVIAEHPERIDPHYPKSYAPMNVVRQHVNSVDYHAGNDQILLSSFIYDEIWIIDHSTTIEEAAGSSGGRIGKGGDLLFRYGNPEAYDKGTKKDRLFLKQHDANWIDEGLPGAGNILVHNNNTIFKPQRPGAAINPPGATRPQNRDIDLLDSRSNVYELHLPTGSDNAYKQDSRGAFLAEHAWYWEHPDYFADFQGGARRLPNGNTLVTDTTDDLVVEVNSEGKIVAEYHGATPVFKAFKYSQKKVDKLLGKYRKN